MPLPFNQWTRVRSQVTSISWLRFFRSNNLKTRLGQKPGLFTEFYNFYFYTLQCTLIPYHSTHRCIRVLHCSKQCYSSSTPRPFSSCAPFTFTTSTDENGFPSVHFSLWCTETSNRVLNPRNWRMFKYSNAFLGKKLLEQKGVVCWGIVLMQHPDFGPPEIQPFLPQNLSHYLSVNTHNVCNDSHTQTSIIANNFTDFLNFFGLFSKSKGDLDVNHFPLLPDPH